MKKYISLLLIFVLILTWFVPRSSALTQAKKGPVETSPTKAKSGDITPQLVTTEAEMPDDIVWQYEHSCSCDDQLDKVVYHEVPQYYQEDYPDIRYGKNTVAESGCGVTCIAMVASYLLDCEYKPDELAAQYGLSGTSHVDRLELMISALGMPLESKVYEWPEIIPALENGQVVIALVDEDSVLTGGQHFIVCTGVTEDGTILVKDPSYQNYEKFRYTKEFENGFDIGNVLFGFQGGWIFEKKST